MKTLLCFLMMVIGATAHAASVTRMAVANGNFTDAATWAVVNQSAAAEVDSEATTNLVTTSVAYSSVFTPGVIDVDGIAIKVSHRTNTPSGTMTITLRNSTLASDVVSVTINVSDIPATDMNAFQAIGGAGFLYYVHGWLLVTFAPQTLVGVTDYSIGVSTSVANQVGLYAATSGNWSRMVRTTTTGAPLVTDKLIIAGEHTGAGAITARTVTMNNTATTVFGQAVTTTFRQSLVVCDQGSLLWDVSASTFNRLHMQGRTFIGEGGTMTIGTPASPVPATSTNRLQFDLTANGDSDLFIGNGGTFTTGGNPVTPWAHVHTSVAAGATSTNFVIAPRPGETLSGWKNTDVLLFPSYSTQYFQIDLRTNAAFANGTNGSLPPALGFTYAHAATNEVGNLTRNVQIYGETTALQGDFYTDYSSTNNIQFTEFILIGSVATATRKEGVTCYVGIGSFTLNGCSVSRTIGYSVYVDLPQVGTPSPIITSNVIQAIGAGSSAIYFGHNNRPGPGSGAGTLVADNLLVGVNSSLYGVFRFNSEYDDLGGYLTLTNNTMTSGLGHGIYIPGRMTSVKIDNNNVHSCNMSGMWLDCYVGSNTVLRGNRFWRNFSAGAIISAGDWTLADTAFYENQNVGCAIQNAQFLMLTNCQFYGGSSFVQAGGVSGGWPTLLQLTTKYLGYPGNLGLVTIINSTFGSPVAHTVADISGFQPISDYQINLYNCTLASATEVLLPNLATHSWVGSEKHDGQAGSNSFWALGGKGILDVTIYNTASPSMRVTPSSATVKFSMPEPYCVRVPVTSAGQRSISVTVRKSAAGDGAAYNGNEPRLIARAEYPLGVTTDTVIATSSGAAGGWLTLSGSTPVVSANGTLLVYVDCDGTTGWINVDDWAFSPLTSLGNEYWKDGFPIVQPSGSALTIGRR